LLGISTYNERENLPALVEQIADHLPQADILIVDDDSPDGTGEWCDQQARRHPQLHCIHRQGKLGLGTATLETMRYAVRHEYRLLVNMDADLSHSPRFLPALVAAMNEERDPLCDVAIGSRYTPGGAVTGWPWRRRMMSRGVNALSRWALALDCQDCSGSFRCYRVAKLAELDLDQVRSRGYAVFEEILWHLRRAGARFVEVPIEFQDRRLGRSKINLREACSALYTIAALGWRRDSEE
jgi:dolichol-phosphate mannosyltransferase